MRFLSAVLIFSFLFVYLLLSPQKSYAVIQTCGTQSLSGSPLVTFPYSDSPEDKCPDGSCYTYLGQGMAATPPYGSCYTVAAPTPTPNAPSATVVPTGPEPCPSGQCKTGLGIGIPTDPARLIKTFFSILLSISGGVALLIIIFSGYNLMASRGNPEKVEGARETLIAAIIGLLFIIFSLVALQVIGYDLLRIPEFKP